MPADDADPGLARSNEEVDIRCDACRSALTDVDREAVSFLLVDDLRIPLLGCETHLETFRSRCGMTTEETAKLLDHRPAGGLTCPGCRNAHRTTTQIMVPVQGGALAILACPQHQAAATHRFETGRHTHAQLTTPINSNPP